MSPVSAQTVIFEDDFESYSNNADVLATAEWAAFNGNAALSSAESNSGDNSIFSPAATSGSLVGGHTPVPGGDVDDDTPLIVTFYYFDADETAGGPLRTGLSYGHWSGGTWGAGAFDNFFAIGVHSPDSTTAYGGRVVNGGSGWSVLTVDREDGWREMQIVIRETEVDFYVDGTLGATDDYDPVAEWNSMRLGLFAGADNTVDVYFDDFSVVLGAPATNVDQWHLHTY